jgi:methyl-accepting chemotaxis protein
MKFFKYSLPIVFLTAMLFTQPVMASSDTVSKPSPDEAIQLLTEGNLRFAEGRSLHPNTDAQRMFQAGTENQGDHAYATVITCSDSRVPVERLFDAGVMDIFVIRVAGNVVDTDEAGSIEYGLAHVNTPVLVILGHTQCGAVTAVTHAINGTGHALERNIPPLVDNIIPAVKRAMAQNPGAHGDDVIPAAIIENIWQGVEDLFMKSPSSRNLVKLGKVKVVGAVYDVGTGKVNWLPELPVSQILSKVETNPERAMNAMAGGGHGETTGNHGNAREGGHDNAKEHSGIAAVPVTLAGRATIDILNIDWLKINTADENLSANQNGLSTTFWVLVSVLVLFGITVVFAAGSGFFGRSSLNMKLYSSFGSMILLSSILGTGAYFYLSNMNGYSHLETAFLDLDMMAGKTNSAQNSYLLHGVENKAYGETQVDTIKEMITEYRIDFTNIEKSTFLSGKQITKLKKMEALINDYEKGFDMVVSAYDAIEMEKEKLDKASEEFDEKLETMAVHHEKALNEAESKGSDPEVVNRQSAILQHLMVAKLRAAKLFHSEVEFLLDKNSNHIGVMEKELGLFKGYLAAIEHEIEDPSEQKQLKAIETATENYETTLKKVITNEAFIEKEVAMINELTHKLETVAGQLSHEAELSAAGMLREANIATIALNLIVLVTGILLAFFITRAITRPINTITTGMNEGANQVASAASQVSTASQSLAEGASEQAASIEETSSSMEEMSSLTRKNAENANQADTLMKEANQVVTTANTSMDQLTQSMEDITKASEETSKIIKTIDEIAFQTNLLALNAAVEAARAGEAGAGFAVVADEVRNLAMRAADAAKNTAQLIEDTVQKVHGGSQLVTTTSDAFRKVAESSGKVGDLVSEISEASKEQSNGIEQVNLAVAEMDKVVQQNAANAEESASASEEMNAQAEQLRDYVGDLARLIRGAKGDTTEKSPAGKIRTRHPHPGHGPAGGRKKMLSAGSKEIRPSKISVN